MYSTNGNTVTMETMNVFIENYKTATEGLNVLAKVFIAVVLIFIFIAIAFALAGVILGFTPW